MRSTFDVYVSCVDQPRCSGVHGGGIQTPATARLYGFGAVGVAYHGATTREHDTSVGGNGTHVLPGRGERTVMWFSYVQAVRGIACRTLVCRCFHIDLTFVKSRL